MNPISLYRFSHFLYKYNIPLIPKFITLLIRFIFNAYIPYELKVGNKFKLGYGGLGVVIHNKCIIGDNCHIDQNVTLGGATRIHGVPRLGNNVYVGAGAKVLGPIVIGNDVIIGANSVVVKSIPSNSLVAGVPGKFVKTRITKKKYL